MDINTFEEEYNQNTSNEFLAFNLFRYLICKDKIGFNPIPKHLGLKYLVDEIDKLKIKTYSDIKKLLNGSYEGIIGYKIGDGYNRNDVLWLSDASFKTLKQTMKLAQGIVDGKNDINDAKLFLQDLEGNFDALSSNKPKVEFKGKTKFIDDDEIYNDEDANTSTLNNISSKNNLVILIGCLNTMNEASMEEHYQHILNSSNNSDTAFVIVEPRLFGKYSRPKTVSAAHDLVKKIENNSLNQSDCITAIDLMENEFLNQVIEKSSANNIQIYNDAQFVGEHYALQLPNSLQHALINKHQLNPNTHIGMTIAQESLQTHVIENGLTSNIIPGITIDSSDILPLDKQLEKAKSLMKLQSEVSSGTNPNKRDAYKKNIASCRKDKSALNVFMPRLEDNLPKEKTNLVIGPQILTEKLNTKGLQENESLPLKKYNGAQKKEEQQKIQQQVEKQKPNDKANTNRVSEADIKKVSDYINTRSKENHNTRFGSFSLMFGGFDKSSKLAAAKALEKFLTGQSTTIDEKHKKILNQGRLGKITKDLEKNVIRIPYVNNEFKQSTLNQQCAEDMLRCASKRVMGQQIHFEYPLNIKDEQIDLGPSFMFSPDDEKQVWYNGNNKDDFTSELNKLDKDKVYFLRTGTNDGAGHWQTLYFDNEKNGWINYSSETNNYQLTEGGKITERGEGLLALHGKWGPENGLYSFLFVEASEKNLISSANYLYDYRVSGPEQALENAFQSKNNFYNNLLNIENISSQDEQPQPGVINIGLK